MQNDLNTVSMPFCFGPMAAVVPTESANYADIGKNESLFLFQQLGVIERKPPHSS